MNNYTENEKQIIQDMLKLESRIEELERKADRQQETVVAIANYINILTNRIIKGDIGNSWGHASIWIYVLVQAAAIAIAFFIYLIIK